MGRRRDGVRQGGCASGKGSLGVSERRLIDPLLRGLSMTSTSSHRRVDQDAEVWRVRRVRKSSLSNDKQLVTAITSK